MMNILVTGGAGFIGKKLIELLKKTDSKIFVIDSFAEKIHGNKINAIENFKKEHPNVILLDDSIENISNYPELNEVETIFHFASETGTGESMYSADQYFKTNIDLTNKLLLHIQNKFKKAKKILLASSRSVYGEGAYYCTDHGNTKIVSRSIPDIERKKFEPLCINCNKPLIPKPSNQETPRNPLSYYALTKSIQEDLVSYFSQINNIDYSIMRFQNVYGPGQSLLNPYTGILAIFSNLAREDLEINVFEDGKETRDFIYIDDLVDIVFGVYNEAKMPKVVDIGSGVQTSVFDVAKKIVAFFGSKSEIRISGNYRHGDIRHNFADLKKITKYSSQSKATSFDQGLSNFLTWASKFEPDNSKYKKSMDELKKKNLLIHD